MKKRSFRHYMRSLHRQVGFLILGLISVYSLSGIILTYRDTSFLKQPKIETRELSPGLTAEELGSGLKMRHFEVEKESESMILFREGNYDKQTGVAKLTTYQTASWVDPFLKLHKSSSQTSTHYVTTALGALLFFMAISSFWMIKPGTRLFRQGIYLTAAGVLLVVILLLI